MSCFKFITLVKWAIIITISVFAIRFWLDRKSFIFNPENVSRIAAKYADASDQNPRVALGKIVSELRQTYPLYILPESDIAWISVGAGGMQLQICVLHASLTEGVVIAGSALGTSGHIGRNWVNASITVVTGELEEWKEGVFTSVTHKPGSMLHKYTLDSTLLRLSPGTWSLHYYRGFLPSAWPMVLSNNIFIHQNFLSLFYLLRVSATSSIQHIALAMSELKIRVKEAL